MGWESHPYECDMDRAYESHAGSITFCFATECCGSVFGWSGDQLFEFRGFKVSKESNITGSDGKKEYNRIKEEWIK